MSKIHTNIISSVHSYTRSKSPWILTEYKSSYGKLIHYLSGGGMRTFGRTVSQEEASIKHRAFLFRAAILGVLWLVFYFL